MMNKTDQGVVLIMVMLLLLYLAVWAIGYFIHKLPGCISILNIASAFAVLGYWATRQVQKQQHYFDNREMIVLGIEVLVGIAAVYTIASGFKYKWVIVMQYIFFAVHLLILLIGLVFMFTFKVHKLM